MTHNTIHIIISLGQVQYYIQITYTYAIKLLTYTHDLQNLIIT
jgi:hypothetical protein